MTQDRPTDSTDRRGYHHGELRQALIEATDAILRETGIEGFSLREAARRAGVSPGAPAHHFGNASGLLTEVALLGYAELGRYLAAIPLDSPLPARLRALATAYVNFALDHPARFRLMFRKDLVNRGDPRYATASTTALSVFAQTAQAVSQVESEDYAVMIAAWSQVHGIAHLAIEDKIGFALRQNQPDDFATRLLPAILKVQWPD